MNEPLICFLSLFFFVCFFHFAKLCTTSRFGARHVVGVKSCYPCCVSCWRDWPRPCCVDEAGSCVGGDWRASASLYESPSQWAQQWMGKAYSAGAGRAWQSQAPTGPSDSPSTGRLFPHYSPLNSAAASHKTCSETQNTPTEPTPQRISTVSTSGWCRQLQKNKVNAFYTINKMLDPLPNPIIESLYWVMSTEMSRIQNLSQFGCCSNTGQNTKLCKYFIFHFFMLLVCDFSFKTWQIMQAMISLAYTLS